MEKIVFLCAGHHGAGTGANGFIDEGEECIKLRNDLSAALRKSGIRTIVDSDKAGLNDVVHNINLIAKDIKGSANGVVIDIHFNAFNGKANGSEVVVHKNTKPTNKAFASRLLKMTCDTLKTTNRGLKTTAQTQHSRLAMLDKVTLPSMIWEICFCDEAGDAGLYFANRNELINNFVKLFK